MEKKFRRVRSLLNKIRQDLKKEGGVRAEIALTRLLSIDEAISRVQNILFRKF